MNCPICDRLNCDRHTYVSWATIRDKNSSPTGSSTLNQWIQECYDHAVDWRARALAAEAEVQVLKNHLSPKPEEG